MKWLLKGMAIIFLAIMLFNCATTKNSKGTEELKLSKKENIKNTFDKKEPPWLMNPPIEEGYFYGIGIDKSQERARVKSIINIGQQFGSGVSTVVEEITIEKDGISKTVANQINNQVIDQIVRGAKFLDEYKDEKGQYWVLSRAPLYCMLDVTEAVLIDYGLKIGIKKEDYKNAIDVDTRITQSNIPL